MSVSTSLIVHKISAAKRSGSGAWSAEEGQYDGGWIHTKWLYVMLIRCPGNCLDSYGRQRSTIV